MSIKLNLKGFQNLIENVSDAEKNLDPYAKQAIEESAQAVKDQLITEAEASGLESSLIDKIRAETTSSNGKYSAKVGWELGAYNPKNPSAGYIVTFLNYGTVKKGKRYTAKGYNRGELKPMLFIARAKKNVRAKVKQIEKEAEEKAVKELKI